MEKNTKEILIEARQLINAPEKWTKGKFAVDKNGIAVDYLSDDAVCFCGYGACARASGQTFGLSFAARSLLKEATGTDHFPRWQDDPERTHDEVMAAFNKAILLADGDRQ